VPLLTALATDRGDALEPMFRCDPVPAARFLQSACAHEPTNMAAPLREVLGRLCGEPLATWIRGAFDPIADVPAGAAVSHSCLQAVDFCCAVGDAAQQAWLRRCTTRPSLEKAVLDASGGSGDNASGPELLDMHPDWVHLFGLVSRIGMLVLAATESSYESVLRSSRTLAELRRKERQRYATDHLKQTVRLGVDLSFPVPLQRALEDLALRTGSRSRSDGKMQLDELSHVLSQAGETAWRQCMTERPRHAMRGPQEIPSDNDTSGKANRIDGAAVPPMQTIPALSGAPLTLNVVADLADLVAQRHRLTARLTDEKLESLAEFAAAASHEFNNPLAVIYGRAQLLLGEECDPERRRALLTIATEATRIHEMLAYLMLFARPPEPHPEVIDLAGQIKRTIDEVRPSAARQATNVEFCDPNRRCWVAADPVQMHVLVGALIRNALESVGHGGNVQLAIERATQGREIVLSVSDDGPGLTEADRRHLFDPLYSGREAGRGMGLGLAKCWQIVQNHGGSIGVCDSSDGRTRLCVHLPAAEPVPSDQSHRQALP